MTVKEFYKIERDNVLTIQRLRQAKGLPQLSDNEVIEIALQYAYGAKVNVKKITRAEVIIGFERYINFLKH